jgi:hypothetical protein
MRFRLAVFGLLVLGGCGSIPNDPDVGLADGELIYINDTWGFQVSRPTSEWGISAQTFLQQRYNNGLPVVEVRIASPLTQSLSSSFRPELYLEPRAISTGIDIDALTVAFEENELKVTFEGYELIGDKQKIQLKNGELVEWQFRNSSFAAQSRQFPGTRFMAAVAVHKDQGYFMVGNGSGEVGFPVAEYLMIAESLKFSAGK